MRHTILIAAAALAGIGILWSADGAPVQTSELEERQAKFLGAIKDGKIEDAYKEILKDSPILADNPEAVANLVEQTQTGLKYYEGASGLENAGVVSKGKHVAFGTGIVLCKRTPLYYYFAWYRESEKASWRLVNIWFNDQAREFLTAQTWMK